MFLLYYNVQLFVPTEAVNKNSEVLRSYIPHVQEMEARQKKKDEMIEVFRQQAEHLIKDLTRKNAQKDAIISNYKQSVSVS